MKKTNYIDRTILKLNRQYGKDEAVAALINKTKEQAVENGQLKSEIQYLEHTIKELKKKHQGEINREARKETAKEEIYKDKAKQIKDLQFENIKLKTSNAQLILRVLEKENN